MHSSDPFPLRNVLPVFERSQHLFGVALRLDIVEYMADRPIRPDHESGTGNPFHLLAIHILFLDDAEFIADLFVGIAKKGVRQVIFGLKLLLCFGIVGRDAQNDGAGVLQLLI